MSLVEVGELLFLENDTETFGVLEQPWAKDANGKDVPTWYTWNADTLTQHLDLTEVDAYPVAADPAWTYSYKFPTAKTTTRIEQLLRSCFTATSLSPAHRGPSPPTTSCSHYGY